MLNETVSGIVEKLNQVFGDGYAIYSDFANPDLKGPCFLIGCLKGSQQQEVGNLYIRRQPFDIQYIPEADNNIYQEINTVAETLVMTLEYIDVEGGLLRGTEMSHEVIDGVLHFYVNFDVRIRKVVEPDPAFETLIINGGVKTSDN